MTLKEAQAIGADWHKKGGAPCSHVVLVLQHTENGYLTGQYVCTRCGEVVCHKSS